MSSHKSSQGRRSRCHLLIFFAFLALPLSATTYYVDNCVVTGNDSNNGTSTSTPWLTVAHVNARTFNPGDYVLFEKTCTWREQLTVPSSGSSGAPITFGAYGSGLNPILTPSHLVTAWSVYASSIYSASYATTANSVWEDSTYLTQVGSLGALTAPGEWYNNTSTHLLYIWTLDGSSPSGHTIEAGNTTAASASAIVLSSISYINIQDLILEKNAATTKGLIEAATSSYVIMSRLELRYGGYQSYGVHFVGGSYNTIQNSIVHDIRNDGIYFSQSSTHDSVLQNIIYNIGQNTDAGDNGAICFGGVGGLSNYGTAEFNEIYNVGHSDTQGHNHTIEVDRSSFAVIRYNVIYDSVKGGISIGGSSTTHITDSDVSSNLVYNINLDYAEHTGEAPGVLVFDGDRINIYNNTIWNIGSVSYGDAPLVVDGDAGQTSNSIAIFNNIIGPSLYRNSIYHLNFQRGSNETYINQTSNNNLFYDPAGIVLENNNSTYTTLASYQKAVTPQDSASLNSNPEFTNVSMSNFTLQAGSPAIDAGANLGATYQMGLNPSSSWPSSVSTLNQDNFGAGWEIGAFVVGQQTFPAPPTSLSATVK